MVHSESGHAGGGACDTEPLLAHSAPSLSARSEGKAQLFVRAILDWSVNSITLRMRVGQPVVLAEPDRSPVPGHRLRIATLQPKVPEFAQDTEMEKRAQRRPEGSDRRLTTVQAKGHRRSDKTGTHAECGDSGALSSRADAVNKNG